MLTARYVEEPGGVLRELKEHKIALLVLVLLRNPRRPPRSASIVCPSDP